MKKFFAFVMMLALLACAGGAFAESEDVAVCSNGVFYGQESDDVIYWLGVPYAKTPERWKAPEAPEESTEEFDAKTFGPMPIQIVDDVHYTSRMPQDEDCLYLNVWKASEDSTALKPVMVWIHGGSFKNNGTGEPAYSGYNFVKDNKNVIFVSIGYRLGLMGFIDLSQVPGGDEYPDSGNLALLDVLQGVKWLNENISAFGGDPENITMIGQSSGSAMISLLMTMPEAKGYFQRAILESGAVSMTIKSADAVVLADKLLELTGKTDMKGLLELSSQDLQDASGKLDGYMNFPELDGRVLTSGDIYSAFAENAGDYDVLIGSNADEARYWLAGMGGDVDAYTRLLEMAYTQTKAGMTAYAPTAETIFTNFMALQENEDVWAYTEFFNELLFRIPAVSMALNHAPQAGNTYTYYWEYYTPGANTLLDIIKACHSIEVPYVLGNPDKIVPEAVLSATSKLARDVQNMWVAFASTGTIQGYEKYTGLDADTGTIIITEAGSIIDSGDPAPNQTRLIRNLLTFGMSGRELIAAMAQTSTDDPETPTLAEILTSPANVAKYAEALGLEGTDYIPEGFTVSDSDAKTALDARKAVFSTEGEVLVWAAQNIKVNADQIYYFVLNAGSANAGKVLNWYCEVSAAADGDSAVFVNSAGEIISDNKIPSDGTIIAMTYLVAGKTYSPYITTASSQEDPDDDKKDDDLEDDTPTDDKNPEVIDTPDTLVDIITKPEKVAEVAEKLGLDGVDYATEELTLDASAVKQAIESRSATFTSNNATEAVKWAMKDLTVTENQMYYFSLKFDPSEAGKVLTWDSGISAAEAGDSAVFLDSKGDIIETVPLDGQVTVMTYLVAGKTYSPYITTASVQEDPDDDKKDDDIKKTTTGPGDSSSGCDSGMSAIMLLLVGAVILKKR